MDNPLLMDSTLPYGAPQFDLIRKEHYLPAFRAAMEEGRAEIDAITGNPEPPDFKNTIEALENSGSRLEAIEGIFYNLLEADADDGMQEIAEELSPLMTEYSLYIMLNPVLFRRISSVYEQRASLNLDKEAAMLLEKTYKSFSRNGARLSDEDKAIYSKYSEELSLLELKFSKNVLDATNAFTLHIQDSGELEGLPQYLVDQAACAAAEKGLQGWVFDLSAPSYRPFMKYCAKRELRERMYMAYSTRAAGGEFSNSQIVKDIVSLRIKTANLLGYRTYADYALERRMVKTPAQVNSFLKQLLDPSLPAAREEVAGILAFAGSNGFTESVLQPWDFPYWSERYRLERYALDDSELKPYFKLENCIEAVLGLAGRLYGLSFTERSDIPVYHKDVKVYDVSDADGRHLALFYADFFPRATKRSGAWMTEFRGQKTVDGKEYRPFISIVTNFSKPSGDEPSLLTHDELTTFLHEFGHSLHGMLAQGRYGSMSGTSVARDFVELPSQIMENWAFEPEYLQSFAKHYLSGEPIPAELVERIVASRNYLAAQQQVRQLDFGMLDMAWHSLTSVPECETEAFEKEVLSASALLPRAEGSCTSTSFSHIFAGGYSAGYYSYKWAEVLEADAFALFKEKGIFSKEVAAAFRREILSRGSSEDEAVLYRNFRGHDPDPAALLEKLGIKAS